MIKIVNVDRFRSQPEVNMEEDMRRVTLDMTAIEWRELERTILLEELHADPGAVFEVGYRDYIGTMHTKHGPFHSIVPCVQCIGEDTNDYIIKRKDRKIELLYQWIDGRWQGG